MSAQQRQRLETARICIGMAERVLRAAYAEEPLRRKSNER